MKFMTEHARRSRENRDGRSLKAARWALAEGVSLTTAARKYDVRVSSVGEAWQRMYPDVPALVSRRAGSQLRSWPEDEVTL